MAGNQRYFAEDDFQEDGTSSQYSDSSIRDRNASAEVSRRVHSLFLQQLYTDVKFVINSGVKPVRTLCAHKAILAVGCDKFKEILFDNNSWKGQTDIQINNIPYDAFRNVVEYLYTNEVFFENELSAIETLSAAQKFQMQPLIDECESYFKTSELNEDNVGAKFQLAKTHNLELLRQRCADFIQFNTEAVLRSPSFVTLKASTVRAICKMEKLSLHSELELLEGVLRYVEAQSDVYTNTSKTILLEPFLRHIRILTLSSDEFAMFVQNHPSIFTAPEAANILMHLANPRLNSNLPSWCNKCRDTRLIHIPPEQRKTIYPPDRYFNVPLKQSKRHQFLSELKCVLRLNCVSGNHVIKAVKLVFADPVQESSAIHHLVINVDSDSMRFAIEERIRIVNSKSCIVKLPRVVLVKCGQSVCITAEAKDIVNYKFLKFDDTQQLMEHFTYAFTSSCPDQLFFISQVIYREALKRTPQRQKYGKR